MMRVLKFVLIVTDRQTDQPSVKNNSFTLGVVG